MSLTGNSHPIVTRGSRISRAPPHHTLPAFLNLHDSETKIFSLSDSMSMPRKHFKDEIKKTYSLDYDFD